MKNFIAALLLCAIFISCGQEPSRIDNSIVTTNDLLPSSQICSKVNFHKNVLLYKNTKNLFQCFGWDQEFPLVFKSLIDLGESNYNIMFAPANNLFFGTDEKRNKFLKFLNTNIKNDNVKSLEVFIKALINEYGVIEAISEIVDVSSQLNLSGKILPVNGVISKVFETTNDIVRSSKNERSKLAKNYQRAKLKNKKFESQFVGLIVQALTDGLKENGSGVKSIIGFLNDGVWPKVMLNTINRSTFKELVYYPLKDKDIIYKAKTINEIISDNRYNCSDVSGVYTLNHSKELDARMEKFRISDRTEFVDNLFDLQLRYSLFTNICPYPELNYIIPSLLNHLASYVLIDGGFDIFKSITKTEKSNNFVLFDFVSSKFFKKLYSTLKLDHGSTKFLSKAFPFLKVLSISNYKAIVDSLKLFDENTETLNTWDTVWSELSSKNKKVLTKSLLNIVLSENDISESLSLITKLNSGFDDMFKNYSESLEFNSENYLEVLRSFQLNMSKESYRKELAFFMSSDRALKLITLMSFEKGLEHPLSESEDGVLASSEEILVLEKNYIESKSTKCLKEFHSIIQVDYDFWTVLEKYPKTCLELNESNKTIAHKIFEWTFDLDKLYFDRFGGKFSVPYGIISGEMMSFYHSIIHLINDNIDNNDNYIREIINSINTHLYDYGFLDILNNSLSISNNVLNNSDLVERLLDSASKTEEKKFDLTIKAMLSLFESRKVLELEDLKIVFDCNSVNPLAGGESCLSKADTSRMIMNMKELLLRNNGNDNLLKELINLLHPSEHIKVPYDSKKQIRYNIKISELVSFLYDATSKKTEEKVFMFGENTTDTLNLNLVERLEVVIREISFLNNFYGAFFINKVASAKKYTKNVKGMKKYVTVMDKTAGFFRSKKIFPESTKWAFKNIFNTYDSLWQVNNDFKQRDGTIKKYGSFIQSILAISVKSSSNASQDFTPFKKPDLELVEKHNGKFISLVAKNNLLSQLANLLRSNFNTKEDLLNNKKFKIISENFLKFTTADELTKSLEVIIKHKYFGLLIDDTLELFSKRSDKDILNLFDLIYVFSKNFRSYELRNLPRIAYHFMESYKVIKNDFNIESFFSFLEIVNKSVLGLNTRDQKLLSKVFVNIINEVSDIDIKLILKSENTSLLSGILDRLVSYDSRIDKSSNTLNPFLNDKRLNFRPLHRLILKIKETDGNLDYLVNIIKLMSEFDENGKSNLEKGLREILISNDKIIESFLIDLFDRFTSADRKQEKNVLK